MKINLLEETLNSIEHYGYKEADVSFVEFSEHMIPEYNIHQISFDLYKQLANHSYKKYPVCGEVGVNPSIKIVFNDNSWLEMRNFDGAYYFVHRTASVNKELENTLKQNFLFYEI